MAAYYNEIDEYAVYRLRSLIASGIIAPGDIDERSIADVREDDLKGYDECHFFAGIGGWSIALRLAGWPADRPVWTGSCPCQPFSTAGAKKKQDDTRHLWPVWFRLIRERRPPIVFGEQVASAIACGWLDESGDDMEKEGYAIGAAVLPACSVGAPHKRDRLFMVFDAQGAGERREAGDVRQTDGRSGGTLPQQPESPIGWEPEPALPRVDNGNPNWKNYQRLYGNSIVPQVAAEFIRAAA